jgi:uncharacterized protein YqeY
MNLKERFQTDLKSAMKAGNSFEVGLLRILQSAIHNKLIEKHAQGVSELGDEEILSILRSETKKRRDAAELFKKGGRSDLEENEKKEIEFISRYLPAELSSEEVKRAVDKILGADNTLDFGSAMKLAVKELKGRVDGRLLGEIIKGKLAARDEGRK